MPMMAIISPKDPDFILTNSQRISSAIESVYLNIAICMYYFIYFLELIILDYDSFEVLTFTILNSHIYN